MTTEKKPLEGLAKMREPFPPNLINKLPKGTKAQNECPANEKVNCKECGGWHHPKIVHLDYVGHAALTDRLLDTDPLWTWEPLAFHDGLPAFDASGGLWIRLTVCGHTRLGYGHAPASNFKEIGSREKEVIGDALRNAAMRFGAALDLWHKGELHPDDEDTATEKPKEPAKQSTQATPATGADAEYIERCKTALKTIFGDNKTRALDKVEELTSFIPKDKTEAERVPGVRDFTKLKGKRIEILTHSLEKLVAKMPKEDDTPSLCSDCGMPIVEGACRNMDCPEGKEIEPY